MSTRMQLLLSGKLHQIASSHCWEIAKKAGGDRQWVAFRAQRRPEHTCGSPPRMLAKLGLLTLVALARGDVMAAIEDAIRSGSDIFNGGDYEGSYYVYRRSAEEMLVRLNHSDTEVAWIASTLSDALAYADDVEPDYHDAAWVMRHAFDWILLQFEDYDLKDPELEDMPAASEFYAEYKRAQDDDGRRTAMMQGMVVYGLLFFSSLLFGALALNIARKRMTVRRTNSRGGGSRRNDMELARSALDMNALEATMGVEDETMANYDAAVKAAVEALPVRKYVVEVCQTQGTGKSTAAADDDFLTPRASTSERVWDGIVTVVSPMVSPKSAKVEPAPFDAEPAPGDADPATPAPPAPAAAAPPMPAPLLPKSLEQTECSVCLVEFADGDELRQLPCGHSFHVGCIDAWLLGTGRPAAHSPGGCRGLAACPLCKAVPVTMSAIMRAAGSS